MSEPQPDPVEDDDTFGDEDEADAIDNADLGLDAPSEAPK